MPADTSPRHPDPGQPGPRHPDPQHPDSQHSGPWGPGDERDLDRTVSYRVPRAVIGQEHAVTVDDHTTRMPSWGEPEEIGFATVAQAPPPPPSPDRRRPGRGWIIALVAAVLVGVLAGGGVWAAAKLSGGGTQPQEVLPAGAIAYARLDLDPAANQKLALFSIARKFSATRDSFTGDDPRQALFGALKKDAPDLSKVDYARDVEPWLGDRIGLALLPARDADGEPTGAVAVQVKDEEAARAGLARLGVGPDKAGLAFRDGYAILAPTQPLADEYAKAAPLSGDERFAGDLTALGEQGVLSFWADAEKLVSAGWGAEAGDVTPVLERVRGMRLAGALRFSGDYAELAGISRGGPATQVRPDPVTIGDLPESTVAAASFSGLGDQVREQWPSIQQAGGETFTRFLDGARRQYGLTLPDDLVTLLGKSLTIAVDEQGLDGPTPQVGALLTTDTAKARDLVERVKSFINGRERTADIATAEGDGRFVVASTQEYAGALNHGGTLGEAETFKLAVPDAGKATYAVYADLDRLEKLYLGALQGQERADAQVLRAVGLSGTSGPDGATFTLRVVFD